MTQLSGKQRRHLRALGHNLDALVQLGKEGITDAFVAALAQTLADHELVKVKVGQNSPVPREDAAAELAARTGSEVAQVLGSMILLYRPHPEEPEITLPRKKGEPAPRREPPRARAAPRATAGKRPGALAAGKPSGGRFAKGAASGRPAAGKPSGRSGPGAGKPTGRPEAGKPIVKKRLFKTGPKRKP